MGCDGKKDGNKREAKVVKKRGGGSLEKEGGEKGKKCGGDKVPVFEGFGTQGIDENCRSAHGGGVNLESKRMWKFGPKSSYDGKGDLMQKGAQYVRYPSAGGKKVESYFREKVFEKPPDQDLQKVRKRRGG